MADLWTAMAGTTDGDHLDPSSEIPIGEAYRLASEWLAEHDREVREALLDSLALREVEWPSEEAERVFLEALTAERTSADVPTEERS